MRRLLATLALGLLTACAATVATSDTVTRACDDYAYGVQAVAPLKTKLDPTVIKLVNAANARGRSAPSGPLVLTIMSR